MEKIGDCYWRYIDWYKYYFGEDTQFWFVSLVFREITEISFQTFGTFSYNGLNLFDTDQLLLAYSATDIKIFTLLVGLNSIICGILWILYVFANRLCHGQFYKQIVFLVDTIFDTSYALYPIFVVYNQQPKFNIIKAVGALQASHFTNFITTIVPITYLFCKCFLLFYKTRYELNKIIKNKMQNGYVTSQPQQSKATVELSELQHNTAQHGQIGVQPNQSSPNTKPQKPNVIKIQSIWCKGTVFLISALYLCFGATFVYFVFDHFDKSSQYCLNANDNDDTLSKHPQLYFWNQCTFKTYPFINAYLPHYSYDYNKNNKLPCNCRRAQIHISEKDFAMNISQSVNVSEMIESVITNWDMLELLYIRDNSSLSLVRITLNETFHYNSKYLTALHIENIIVDELTNDVGNWKEMEYFYITHAHWHGWPSNFGKLNKISYLYLHNTLYIDSLPPNLCKMSNLKAINIFNGLKAQYRINVIPRCIINLKQLQSLIIYLGAINELPYELFSMPSINEIGIIIPTNFTYKSFRNENNTIMSDSDWDKFSWKHESNTTYYLQSEGLCHTDEYEVPRTLDQFLTSTGACETVCDSASPYNFVCLAFMWQDGVCNSECNVKDCLWDGGDCNIICSAKYPQCNIFNMFENDVCDISCNHTVCDFDKNECIVDELDNIIFSENQTHCVDDDDINVDTDVKLCPIEWVGDGWCDDNCRTQEECYYDANDCICDATNCFAWYQSYKHFISDGDDEIADGQIVFTRDFVCWVWEIDTLVYELDFSIVEQWKEENKTCDFVFRQLDLNNNSYVDFNEILYFGSEDGFDVSQDKALQINCTSCYGIVD